METIVSSENRLNESLSRKEVTFSNESSILFYAIEGTVDSLNDSERHIVKNDNIPLSAETSSKVKNSNRVGSDSKFISEQCLYDLPEAMVVLEKLPEDLFHKYAYLNNDLHRCVMPTTTRNTDKTSSLTSNHLRKFTEPVINEISPILKKECQLRSSKSSLSGNFINENSSVQLPSPTKNKASECVNKSNIGKKHDVKLIDSAISLDIISQMKCGKISFHKYPCIHLERLNLKPYLESVANTYDNCLQNKRDMSLDLDTEVGNIINNMADLSVSQRSALLNEVVSKTINSSPIIDVEENSDISLSEDVYTEKNKGSLLPDISPEIPSNVNNFLSENLSIDEAFLQDESIMKDVEGNSDISLSEDVYTEKNKESLLPDILPEIPSNVNNFLSENLSIDEAFLQDESIVKDINCENSSLYRNAQNKFPFVLLERLNLPLIETDMNFGTDISEFTCTDSVPTDITEHDIPIQIDNVCSISRESFNTAQNLSKNTSSSILKKILETNKSPPNLYYADQFNENLHIANSTSSHVNSFNNSESILENLSSTSSDSINEDTSFLKVKSKNAHSYQDFTDSSLNDSTSDDIPLIAISKQKLMDAHSFYGFSGSSNYNTTISLAVETNSKNSRIKSHKHKKKNSMHRDISLIDSDKNNKSLTPTTIDFHKKACKHKKRNSIHNNVSSSLGKTNAKLSVATKTKNLHTKHQQCKKNKHKSIEISPLVKKKKKKSSKKQQLKVYKMMIKYLKMQIKSKKHKKKCSKRKQHQEKSKNLISSNDKDDSDSNDSVAVIYESTGEPSSLEREETSTHCEAVSLGESSTVKRKNKSKKHKKNVDKYRLGFLSNKCSLRFYNRFLASERLLLSKCKKNEKKKLKRLFHKLKAVGLVNYK